MKRITGITLAVAAFIGCSYIGTASASQVCERIFSETPLVESGRFADIHATTPVPADKYKNAVIDTCDSAIAVGKAGGQLDAVAGMAVKNIVTKNDMSSMLSLTMVSVAMTGWAVGAEERSEK